MERSDYLYSLRALDYWMDDLEREYKENQDPDTEEVLIQIDKSFHNIYRLFEEHYKQASNNMPPEDLKPKSDGVKMKQNIENSFRREVSLTDELIEVIRDLIRIHSYSALKPLFENLAGVEIYLNLHEAEALVNLAVIEKRKDMLRRQPGITSDAAFGIQQSIYCDIISAVTEVFEGHSFDHLF